MIYGQLLLHGVFSGVNITHVDEAPSVHERWRSRAHLLGLGVVAGTQFVIALHMYVRWYGREDPGGYT